MRIDLSPDLEKLIMESVEEISSRAAVRLEQVNRKLIREALEEMREMNEQRDRERPDHEWLTVKEAVDIAGVTRETLWRHAKAGDLKVKKVPRGNRHRVFYEAFSVRELARVLKRRG